MKFVGVTGCPTGIAHSQMAAESLETAVEGTDDEIKVEVHGSSGTENILSDEDVEEAEAVIVASDISVKTDRFEGMPSVHTSVQSAVTDAEELIEKAREANEEGLGKVKYKSEANSLGLVEKIKNIFS